MNRYALVIGISEYSSNPLQSLPKAASDAESLAQLLEEHGNFQVERIPKRWDKTKNRFEVAAKPITKKQIIKELKTLLWERAVNSEALIYFAGHGLLVFDDLDEIQGFLAASDTRIENVGERLVKQDNAIPLELLNRLIQKASVSRLVMLLDCCHSGSFLESDSLRQTLTAFSAQKDYYLIAACRSFETARAYKNEPHSIFSGAIIQGLDVANADSKGQISCDSLFDYTQRKLQDSGQEPIRMGGGRSITLVTHQLVDITLAEVEFNLDNPYLGLHAFEPENESYFYGRDTAIRALLDRISKGRFLSVIGASGCGKSSLVKAGLLPRLYSEPILDSDHWVIEQLTPGTNPLDILIDKLTPLHHLNQPFLLFIDQFEEVFTLCKNDAQRRAFFRLLAEEAKTNERQGRLIVAVRGDFLDRCAEYTEIADLINSTQPTTYFVEPLSPKELGVAITEPAKLHGVSFEPGLVSQMVEDVIRQPGALPLLQYALWELWRICVEKAQNPKPRLTWQCYNYIGKVGGALDTQASLLYQSFPSDAHRELLQRLFLELVELGEGETVTRRRVTRESLANIADSPEQLEQVLGLLVKRRLLVITTHKKGENGFVTYVEVAHEALLTKWKLLQDWIAQNRDNLRVERRFQLAFQLWRDTYHKSDDALLGGLWLASVVEWQQKAHPRLTDEEQEFITRSVTRRDHVLQEQLAQERKLKELAEAKAEEEEAKALAEIEKAIEAEKRAQAEAEKAEEANKRVRLQKQRTKLAIASLIGVTSLTILAGIGWLQAQKSEILALSQTSQASFVLNRDSLDSLLTAIEATQKFKRISWLPGNSKVHEQVMEALTQAVYWVRERNRLKGHNDSVQSVTFSPDGTMIASAGYDNQAKLWDRNGQELPIPPLSHDDAVMSVSFSNDSQIIATASLDKTVKLWNRDGSLRETLDHDNWVYGVAFSQDNQIIVTGDSKGIVTVWNLEGVKKNSFPAHEGIIAAISFSRDGTLATASVDKTAKLWQLQELEKPNPNPSQILNHQDIVYAVSFNNNEEDLVATASKSVVKIWNSQTGEEINTLARETKFYSVIFSPDSNIIAAATEDGKIQLWDRYWIEIDTLEGHSSRVRSVSFSPDGETLASASSDHTIKLWQAKLPQVRKTKAHTDSVNYLSFRNDGEVIASASSDNTIKIWNQNAVLQQTLNEHSDNVDHISFSPEGKIIISTSRDDTVKIWNLEDQQYQLDLSINRNSELGYSSISFSPDPSNPIIAVADTIGSVKLFNLDGTIQDQFPAHNAQIFDVAFSPNGANIATASDDQTIKLWDLQGTPKNTLESHSAGVWDVTFSRNGKTIATASKDKIVKLWDQEGNFLRDLKGHSASVIRASFNPEGNIIATGSNDQTVKLWDIQGRLIATLKGHESEINGLDFNPNNGNLLVSGSSDGTMILWRVDNLNLDSLLSQGCNSIRNYLHQDYQDKTTKNLCRGVK